MLIFGLQQLLPGDPAMILAGEERDPTVIAYLRENDAPRRAVSRALPATGCGGVLHGDLGESLRHAAAGARR